MVEDQGEHRNVQVGPDFLRGIQVLEPPVRMCMAVSEERRQEPVPRFRRCDITHLCIRQDGINIVVGHIRRPENEGQRLALRMSVITIIYCMRLVASFERRARERTASDHVSYISPRPKGPTAKP
jgi:hypothetical protein